MSRWIHGGVCLAASPKPPQILARNGPVYSPRLTRGRSTVNLGSGAAAGIRLRHFPSDPYTNSLKRRVTHS